MEGSVRGPRPGRSDGTTTKGAADFVSGVILYDETLRQSADDGRPFSEVLTSQGIAFIGAAADDYLRAFDVETGEELWKGRLPAGGQATPMAYRVGDRPFVVIAAGGHGRGGTTLGDALVAFSLRKAANW